MKAPIIAVESAFHVYVFIDEFAAMRYLEPTDIRNREYEIFDSEGTVLEGDVVNEAVELRQTASTDSPRLAGYLRRYLARAGINANSLDLAALVKEVVGLGFTK